jgi:hypothetical protein
MNFAIKRIYALLSQAFNLQYNAGKNLNEAAS